MAEYIDRELLDKAMTTAAINDENKNCSTWANAISVLYRLHAADVAPVVHGRWIHSRYENCSEQFELVKCSQCNHEAYAMAFYVRGGNYCPNCGARMDGGVE